MAKCVIDIDFLNKTQSFSEMQPLPEFVTEVMLENTKLHDERTLLQRMNDKIYDALGLLYTVPSDEAIKLIKALQARISLQKRALKDCADREHNDGKTIENLRSIIDMHREEVERVSKVCDLQTHKIMAKDGTIENQQQRLNNQKATIDDLLAKNKELVGQRDEARESARIASYMLAFPPVKIETVRMGDLEVQERIANLESDIRLRDEIIANQRELVEQANSGYVAYKEIHLADQAKNEALVKHANDTVEQLNNLKRLVMSTFGHMGSVVILKAR